MSYNDVKPIYEHICSCRDKNKSCSPTFRIIEDDGCYMVLIPDSASGSNYENWNGKTWKPTPWIFPEAHDILKKLSRPRGALYDIKRDGPLPPMNEEELGTFVEKLVEERKKPRKDN